MRLHRLRRHRAAFLALLCAGIALVLVLLAADVSAWRSTVARDDLRFRALPAHRYAVHPADEQPDPQLAATWRDAIAKLLVDGSAPIPGGDPEPQPTAAAA